MSDQMHTPANPAETQEALRNTAAAIRLCADGHLDEMAERLDTAGPLVSSSLLTGLVVTLAGHLGMDPREIADKLIYDAEQNRMTFTKGNDDD